MPVGNDLVDLRDPGSQPDAIHPRFDARVFTATELGLIAACPDDGERHKLRWTLWAAKESVLKLVRQREPTAPFRPRDFPVRLRTADSAEVAHGSAVYAVDLDVTEERIHAVARDVGRRKPLSGISRSESYLDAPDVSVLVRAQAARSVGERLGIEPEEIEIRGRIPKAMRAGKRLPVDISMSHHGRYLAHAVFSGALLFAVALAGCTSPTDPDVSESRARWQALELESYRFDYRQSCFCAFTEPVRITVEAGAVVAVDPLDGGSDDLPLSAFPTIDDLFDRLEAAEASDPVVFEVQYDPVRGFPTLAEIDISLQIADEEFSFTVEDLVATSGA